MPSMRALCGDIGQSLGLSAGAGQAIVLHGDAVSPSPFAVCELAAAAIGMAGEALAELVGLYAPRPQVTIDARLAYLWFGMTLSPQGWSPGAAWDAIAGDYATRDGWIRLHTNAPHHRAAALAVLDCAPTREAVAAAVAGWAGEALEAAIVAGAGCTAFMRDMASWRCHPQGEAVGLEPLVIWDMACTDGPEGRWCPSPERPLAGLRVLDLTRVLAGPVATRFLAGFGAEVLRIDPPGWDEPGVVPEVTLGKRCARLDLHAPGDRAVFERLLAGADMLVHGYRGDALEGLGYGAQALQELRPGLIDVSLNAYGHSGPWQYRRGFDSLLQFSTGIADAGMAIDQAAAPVSLPVQALDQATGYLMAAACIRGVIARQQGTGPRRARLSLARTASLLIAAPRPAHRGPGPVIGADDLAAGTEATGWGPAQRVKPPLVVGEASLHWSLPAMPLGSHAASWQG